SAPSSNRLRLAGPSHSVQRLEQWLNLAFSITPDRKTSEQHTELTYTGSNAAQIKHILGEIAKAEGFVQSANHYLHEEAGIAPETLRFALPVCQEMSVWIQVLGQDSRTIPGLLEKHLNSGERKLRFFSNETGVWISKGDMAQIMNIIPALQATKQHALQSKLETPAVALNVPGPAQVAGTEAIYRMPTGEIAIPHEYIYYPAGGDPRFEPYYQRLALIMRESGISAPTRDGTMPTKDDEAYAPGYVLVQPFSRGADITDAVIEKAKDIEAWWRRSHQETAPAAPKSR
ncbi:MAG: hypothetical protein J0L97_10070, partial [Alphaproteobacteria bacterium]|nr:hypothetical protein [Alphaproteobacteria bacterium]